MQAVALRCEHREDVPCVDSDAPRLSWALDSPEPGKRQTAYRIQVAGAGVCLWDTGCVESAETVDIPYGGLPLPPASEITWAVQVWDGDGNASKLCEPAHFLTGPATWEGVWIAADPAYDPAMPVPGTETDLDVSDLMMRRLNPCPYFRRSIDIDRPIRRATLYATARGTLELEVNGARVGDAVLAPGWTDYARRIEYDAHDVTNLLHAGENVLGAIVGDGWYSAFVGMDARRPGNHSAPTPSSCASCTSSTRTTAAPWWRRTAAGGWRPDRSCTPTC